MGLAVGHDYCYMIIDISEETNRERRASHVTGSA
jgi:hypothetical protein